MAGDKKKGGKGDKKEKGEERATKRDSLYLKLQTLSRKTQSTPYSKIYQLVT